MYRSYRALQNHIKTIKDYTRQYKTIVHGNIAGLDKNKKYKDKSFRTKQDQVALYKTINDSKGSCKTIKDSTILYMAMTA